MNTFEKIRDRLAAQECDGITDDPTEQVFYESGFKAAFDLLRPLLDGWIRVGDRLPVLSGNVLIVHVNSAGVHISEALFEEDKFMYIAETPSGTYKESFGIVTHWREIPSLPGSYVSLEELINKKIK